MKFYLPNKWKLYRTDYDVIDSLRKQRNLNLLKEFLESNEYLYFSNEPFEHLTIRWNLKPSLFKNNTIICASNEESNNLNIIKLPFYHLYRSDVFYKDFKINFNIKPKKKFITLIGIENAYRVLYYDFIKNYLTFGYYNFNWLKLTNLKKTARNYPLAEEYNNAFWEFGIETGDHSKKIIYTFISEKTWRPLLLGKPFLNFGYPGMYKRLESYGITPNPDINYNFDNNTENRFELFCNEVKRLLEIKNLTKFKEHSLLNQKETLNILGKKQDNIIEGNTIAVECPMIIQHIDRVLSPKVINHLINDGYIIYTNNHIDKEGLVKYV